MDKDLFKFSIETKKPSIDLILDLMPVKAHRELRMLDILSAMTQHISDSKKIPLEWINELDAINERIY